MSSSSTLDVATATWLSGLDPALASLPAALPDPSGGQRLHDVRWTPGEGCRLSYRDESPGAAATFVAVDVTGGDWSRYDYRDDARLPGLARAADPLVVGTLLTGMLGERLSSCRVEPVRFRSGSRCVLRYEATTRTGTTTLYAKVFRPERFDQTASLGRDLAGSSRDHALVPELAATWPELQVLVGEAVPGLPASVVLGDPGVPAQARVGLARRLGALLARFHAIADVPAPRWTAEDQVASLADAMAAVHHVDPELAARLLSCLEVLGASVPAPGRQVLSHGSFRASQVVLTPEGDLVALDTDRLSRSDRARDLGAVLAHLTWQGIRQSQERVAVRADERAMLSGYQGRAGMVDPQALLWWRAAGLLQVAVRRYRRLEVTAWPAVPRLADAVEELLAAGRARRATDVLDCTEMTREIRHAMAPGRDDTRTLHVRSAQLLTDNPGRRRVVRYDLDGLDDAGRVPVIGKVFTELERARLLHEHLRVLSTGPFRAGPRHVPTPLALLPRQRMVLYRAAEGTPLDHIADPAHAVAGVRAAAQWLALLHGSSVRLPRRLSLAQEQQSSQQWAALISGALPTAARPARALAARWASAVTEADQVEEAPIHKDFHAGHVLIGRDVCVVDLDEARLGDPALDVAHFCAYLEAAAGPATGDLMRTAFLDEYTTLSGWVDSGSHAGYCAYTWLKIAKQLALGSGPFRDTPTPARRGLVVSALTKGLACLDA
ncbi:phosphotransferase family protein [Nocardioides sp.]|uniref:phosphotransferase family protein n=1 Tax=Nocardioides sp. TaxID=35761 RepID=UPI002ED46959